MCINNYNQGLFRPSADAISSLISVEFELKTVVQVRTGNFKVKENAVSTFEWAKTAYHCVRADMALKCIFHAQFICNDVDSMSVAATVPEALGPQRKTSWLGSY